MIVEDEQTAAKYTADLNKMNLTKYEYGVTECILHEKD